MGYQTNTETENKKDSSLENVSEINRESGFITAEDILKNCASPEDAINEIEEMLDENDINISTKKENKPRKKKLQQL